MNTKIEALAKRGSALLEENIESAKAAVAEHRATLAKLQEQLEDGENYVVELERALLVAKASEGADSIPVGTRVKHHFHTDILGTVVEGDGSGIAVQQDNAQHPTYGFGPAEWLVIEEGTK